jgi:hypothetical protein
MVSDNQVIDLLTTLYAAKGFRAPKKYCVFTRFEALASFLVNKIHQGAYAEAAGFLKIIQAIYADCSGRVRIAIENVLLYRLATCLEMSEDRGAILALIPPALRVPLKGHLVAAGI